MSHINCHI